MWLILSLVWLRRNKCRLKMETTTNVTMTLFSFYCAISPSCGQSDVPDVPGFFPTPGCEALNEVIRIQVVSFPTICGERCKNDPSCLGFNYERSTKICVFLKFPSDRSKTCSARWEQATIFYQRIDPDNPTQLPCGKVCGVTNIITTTTTQEPITTLAQMPGPPGEKGTVGDPGSRGVRGWPGADGEPGPHGSAGDKGAKGDDGLTGPVGPMGAQGVPGIQGPPGKVVTTSEGGGKATVIESPAGQQGLKGDKGDTGEKGTRGDPGPRGHPGEVIYSAGPAGPPGPPGLPGTSSANSVPKLPQSPCPNDWVFESRSCSCLRVYAYSVWDRQHVRNVNRTMSFCLQRSDGEAISGHIKTPAQWKVFKQSFKHAGLDSSVYVWIGASDEEVEGSWVWPDGTQVTSSFNVWHSGTGPANANRASNWAVSSYRGWRDIGMDWVTNQRPGGYLCVITGLCRKKLDPSQKSLLPAGSPSYQNLDMGPSPYTAKQLASADPADVGSLRTHVVANSIVSLVLFTVIVGLSIHVMCTRHKSTQ